MMLISPAYRQEQIRLHGLPTAYGERGSKWDTTVNGLIWVHGCQSVLDYGCGQGSLRESLLLSGRCRDLREYDPGVIGKDALPVPADLVVCTDVLEHVEPDLIGAVLSHLRALSLVRLFTSIALTETEHRLSDGRQAHILLRPVAWWRAQFAAHGFALEAEPRVKKPEKQWAAVWI